MRRFRDWLDGAYPHVRGPGRVGLTGPETKAAGLRELAGYDLACYCPLDDGLPCHREVWLDLLATSTPQQEQQ